MSDHEKTLRYGEAEFSDRVDSGGFGPRTQQLYDHLTSRVIGQDRAAKKLAQGYSIYHAGLKEPTLPIGAHLFAGPTGWGKTYMAEELARFLIQDEPRAPLIRIPCGKYSERHRVSELIGSPPGYVDSDKLPGLAQVKIDEPHFWVKARKALEEMRGKKGSEKMDPDMLMMDMYERHRPYTSVILFDEVEKAHPDLWNALLHIIGDGELSFPHGDVTSFANSVIILTCNVGGREQQEKLSGKSKRIGFGGGAQGFAPEDLTSEEQDKMDQEIYEETLKLVEQRFPPELVGRLREDIVVFRTLKRDQCMPVLENMLGKVQDSLIGPTSNSIPILVMYSQQFKDFLLDKGVKRLYGMRPLKRTIHRFVRLPLANAIESGALRQGDEVMFKIVDGRPALFKKPRAALALPAPRREYVPPKKPDGKPPNGGKP